MSPQMVNRRSQNIYSHSLLHAAGKAARLKIRGRLKTSSRLSHVFGFRIAEKKRSNNQDKRGQDAKEVPASKTFTVTPVKADKVERK